MKGLLTTALLLIAFGCKSDCEKAAEALCKDYKNYDRCYGVKLMSCAQGKGE